LKLDKEFVAALVGLAHALQSDGKSAQAEKAAQQALELKNSRAPHAMRWVLEQRGDAKAAEKSYRAALECDAKFAAARLNLAHLLARDGKLDAALTELDRAQKDAPGNPQVNVHRGIVLASAGRNKQAAAAYEQAVKDAPEDVLLLLLLAESYVELSGWKLATKALSLAEGLEPRDADAWLRCGYVSSKLNRAKDAVKALEKAFELDPENLEILKTLGIIYETDLGKSENAIDYYRRYLDAGGKDACV